MTIITKDEDRVLILHPVRKKDGSVQMKQLRSFKNLAALSRILKPAAWSKLTAKFTEKYSHFDIDWDDLYQQAQTIVGGPLKLKSETDEKALALRAHLAGAADLLSSLRRSDDDKAAWKVLQRSGDEVQQLVRSVAHLVEQFRHPEEERFGLFRYVDDWMHLVANSEASFEFVEQARFYFRKGKTERAKVLLEEARKLDPFDPDIDNSEGVLLLEAGRPDEAEPFFRKAIAVARHLLPVESEGPWAWSQHEVRPLARALSNLAQVHRDREEYEKAIKLWKECLALCPDNPLYCDLELGGVYLRMGRPERALPHLHYAKFSMISICDPHFNAAIAHLALGETEAAAEEMLNGMLVNAYVAPKILRKRVTPRARHWSNVADPEWATDYVNAYSSLWNKEACALLKQLYNDPEVTAERDAYFSEAEDRRDFALVKGRKLKAIKQRLGISGR